MIELPEARTIARDLKKEILGKEIIDVKGNFTDHKFTFYYDNPEQYKNLLVGKKITAINERNFYIELETDDCKILFRDGANIRYYDKIADEPEKSKLLLKFEDGSFINVTVAMYACIFVYPKKEKMDNPYYEMELTGMGALDKSFSYENFKNLIDDNTLKLSAKAFLATEQRILGIGNGVVQDILFHAKINPKTKIRDLSDSQIQGLYESTVNTIKKMIEQSGRDTEKDIYGDPGKYKTIMSNTNYKNGCPICKGAIKKESFLGGSIYYCPTCQR